jgi:acetyl-CoA carboxylase biotin carboxyl carrier protein
MPREEPPNAVAAYVRGALLSLLELVLRSDVRELELQEGEMRVRLHRTAPAVGDTVQLELLPPATEMAEPEPGEIRVTAPLVGTFYRAPKPGQPPLVSEGSRVDDDSVIGIIEALHVLTEVEAGCSGVVTGVLATDGQPVEYGQALIEVRPSG